MCPSPRPKHSADSIIKELCSIDSSMIYASKVVNRQGNTSDTGEPFTEVISKHLLDAGLVIKPIPRKSPYLCHHRIPDLKDNGSNRGEERKAIQLFKDGLNGKELSFGKVFEYQVPIKGVRGDKAGKIDLIVYKASAETVFFVELKIEKNKDTLLRAALEIETYFQQIDTAIFKDEFRRRFGGVKAIRKALLLYPKCRAYEEYVEMQEGKRPAIKALIEEWRIIIVPEA